MVVSAYLGTTLSFPLQFQPLTPFLILIFVTAKILDDLWGCSDTLVCVLAYGLNLKYGFETLLCLPHVQHAFEAKGQQSNMDVDILFDNKAFVCCS